MVKASARRGEAPLVLCILIVFHSRVIGACPVTTDSILEMSCCPRYKQYPQLHRGDNGSMLAAASFHFVRRYSAALLPLSTAGAANVRRTAHDPSPIAASLGL